MATTKGRKALRDTLMREHERTRLKAITRKWNNFFRRKSKGGKGG